VEDGDEDGPAHSESSDDEGDIENYNFEEDDEDFWEEQYGDNYSSALDLVDEILDFKNTVSRLAQEQSQFYTELIKTVPVEDLAGLEEKIQKALEKVEQHINTSH
jgi:hypothetical protein